MGSKLTKHLKISISLATGPESRTGSAGEALAVELLNCAAMGGNWFDTPSAPLGETGAADLWATTSSADVRFRFHLFLRLWEIVGAL